MAKNNNETKKTETEAPKTSGAPPTTDERIKVLEQLVEDNKTVTKTLDQHLELANSEIQMLMKKLKEAETRATDAEKRLKLAKSAPTGDVVVLGGKTWAVKGTVQAKFALDEVKKGFILEDATLVILGNEAE